MKLFITVKMSASGPGISESREPLLKTKQLHTRGNSRISTKRVQNTHDTRLIVENVSNCKGFRY